MGDIYSSLDRNEDVVGEQPAPRYLLLGSQIAQCGFSANRLSSSLLGMRAYTTERHAHLPACLLEMHLRMFSFVHGGQRIGEMSVAEMERTWVLP